MPRRNLPLFLGFCIILIGLQAAFWFLPKESFSESEKRVLQEAPSFRLANLWNGKWFASIDQYISDHFAKRDFWVGLHAYANQVEGLNAVQDIYQGSDGWLLQAPVKVGTTLDENLKAVTDFSDKHPEIPISFLCVPTTGAIMQEKLPALHDSYPDQQILIKLQKQLGKRVQWVDIVPIFQEHRDDDIYYRTDHHWTSQGAYLAYYVLAQEWGMTPADDSRYVVQTYNDFYGTTYSKSGLWATKPDTISLWEDPEVKIHVTIQDENRPATIEHDGVFFTEHLKERDKYPIFLDGNHARVTLTSNTSGGNLLIIRDSFAHCFAPFLSRHFQSIDLIDLRYFKKQTVSELIEQNGYDQILFLCGMETLTDDRSFQWLA